MQYCPEPSYHLICHLLTPIDYELLQVCQPCQLHQPLLRQPAVALQQQRSQLPQLTKRCQALDAAQVDATPAQLQLPQLRQAAR
jgi:hypothetical protein